MAPSSTFVTFPKTKANKHAIQRILQLEWELAASTTAGMIEVSGFINLVPRTEENPYPWCEVPMTYRKPLGIALFRYEILKIAAMDTVAQGGNKEHIDSANINLVYMDKILTRFFDDAKGSVDLVGRYDTFVKWIRTEFYVRKHNPDDVSAWELLNPNIDLALGTIEDLGMILLLIHYGNVFDRDFD